MDPRGKVALMTGGARIGVSIAEHLAARGAHVAVSYRHSRESAEETLAKVTAHGVTGLVIPADVTQPEDVARLVNTVKHELGRLDILINMASVYTRTPFERLDDTAWRESLETDLAGTHRVSLAVAPLMQQQGGGRIINFADWLSASGRPRYKEYLPYYVAKAGVIGLTEALALELAPHVLVNAIAPGPILRPAGMSDEGEREVRQVTPLGRWGGPEEIAKAALFLVESDFVTGECIRVDGGRHLR